MKRIVLIGDQICSDLTPVLTALLKEKAELWLAPDPVRTSVDTLVGVREWIPKRQPSIAVLTSGVMDTRKICFGDSERVVPLDVYARNVRCALKIVLEQSTATPVWATIPAVDVRRVEDEEEFGYDNETVSLYNEEAKSVARSLGVQIIDLYGIVKAAARSDSARPDGIRLDQHASDYLAKAIATRLSDLISKS
ncbi:SGNH/GDSL hydrolase family protein [Pelagicoccus albus]|uniref:SGNH/GDSL hydrolase family protein n=1 Tax=Pelagicoccus albus TaxID=415222 RepID=A0A7X1B703_9BACT|nr:hypothetical protein [Pelagicoccus albus]MBC2606811.1 hypothetical protein [Pelagicoccus albus]